MTPISFLFCYGGGLKARMEMLHRFRQCSWLIALRFFCLCVALKLNGSSVGMWEQELSERKASKGLLLFNAALPPTSIVTMERGFHHLVTVDLKRTSASIAL